MCYVLAKKYVPYSTMRLLMLTTHGSKMLFVYGTLRKDQKDEMCPLLAGHAAYVGEGRVHGELYDLTAYPGMFMREGCLEMVRGEVYELDSNHILRIGAGLDEYEGVVLMIRDTHEYRRQKVHVFLDTGTEVDAWPYVLRSLPPGAVRAPVAITRLGSGKNLRGGAATTRAPSPPSSGERVGVRGLNFTPA